MRCLHHTVELLPCSQQAQFTELLSDPLAFNTDSTRGVLRWYIQQHFSIYFTMINTRTYIGSTEFSALGFITISAIVFLTGENPTYLHALRPKPTQVRPHPVWHVFRSVKHRVLFMHIAKVKHQMILKPCIEENTWSISSCTESLSASFLALPPQVSTPVLLRVN